MKSSGSSIIDVHKYREKMEQSNSENKLVRVQLKFKYVNFITIIIIIKDDAFIHAIVYCIIVLIVDLCLST